MRNLKRALSLGLTAAMISGLMVMGSSAVSYPDSVSYTHLLFVCNRPTKVQIPPYLNGPQDFPPQGGR